MIKIEKDIKKYQLSIKQKMKILFQNYEFGMPIIESFKNARFQTIDEFADKLMCHHNKNFAKEQDFYFTLNMKSDTQESLKKYLIKQKKFILNYIMSQDSFENSHIYQLCLQYIPYKLNGVEKNILLDGYITMLTDLKGQEYSYEKRKRLEKKLSINQD